MRIKFRTKTSQIEVPEIVRPVTLTKALEQLKMRDMVFPAGGVKEPTISWEEARSRTQDMVEESLARPNAWCLEYTTRLGISEEVGVATREYAEWSAAAELRLLSSEGVDIDQFTKADFRKYCGRGLPWRTQMVKLGRPEAEKGHRRPGVVHGSSRCL